MPHYMLASRLLIVTGYAAVGGVLLLVAASWLRRNPRNLLCKPVIPFLCTMVLVHSAMPIAELLTRTFRYQWDYSLEAHIESWIATILGAFSVVLGAMIAGTLTKRRAAAPRLVKAPKHDRSSFFFFMVLPSLFACYKLYSVVSQIGYKEFLSDRIWYSADVQGWAVLSNVIVVVPAFYLASYLANQRRRRALIMAIGSFGLSAFFILTTGSRNSVFLALICALLVYFFYHPKLPTKRTLRMFVLVCGGGFVLAMYGQYRRSLATDASPGVVVTMPSVVTAIGGAFGNHELLLWQVDHPHSLYLGETYLAGFTVFIPRALWPSKPLGAGPRIKNEIQPGSYVLGERGLSSLTTGFLVEAWMNFGLVGPVVVGLIWGAVLSLIGVVARRVNSPFGISIVAYLVLTCGFSFVYSEFLGWMGRTIPIVVGLVAARVAGRSLFRFHALPGVANRYTVLGAPPNGLQVRPADATTSHVSQTLRA